MKLLRLFSLLAFLSLSTLIFTACEEDTEDPVSSDKPIPAAPTNLRATSISATEVLLKWDKSASHDSSWFAGYELTVTGGNPMTPIKIGKTDNYKVSGLQEGVVYTFTLKSVNSDNKTSTGSTSVTWSPATRFETDDIRMYVYESQNGSGLTIYGANNKPENLKATEKTKWHLGLDNRTSGALFFGSASQISIGTGTPTDKVEIATTYWKTNTLDNVFENKSLNTLEFAEQKINLLQLDDSSNTGIVFVVRILRQGQTSYNYAKVLVERGSAGFLQGSGNDRYIKMKISYQKVAGVPYAKTSN
ncbi:MAG: fibronectin type III domain-containing protein [Ignavibacteria bacterium]|nr:fibronectin type III domain-containing protein [Ignavibacteria bacterium]